MDGRNIISGRKSHLQPDERMYILGPYQTGEYKGWRTGRNRVNKFYFSLAGNSYASAWSDYSSTGTIAVAFYRAHHRNMNKHREEQKHKSLTRKRAQPGRMDPGTGFGEKEWSPSRTVRFTPQKYPLTREFIRYEWRSKLCRMGVIKCRKKKIRHNIKRNRTYQLPKYGFAPFPNMLPLK